MFPPSNGLLVSDDVAQVGDALLTLVRHEVRQETPEATSRRRLETFVLRAEQLVARLAERQDETRQTVEAATRREALLRYQLEAAVRWQGDAEAHEHRLHTALVERVATRETEAARAWAEILRLSYSVAHLEDHLAIAEARIAVLEARTLPARWSRFVGWVRRLWRT